MNTTQKKSNELLSGTLNDDECAKFYHTYTNLSRGENLFKRLKDGKVEFLSIAGNISEEGALYRYAEGKWSVKEVLGHMIDTERIMCFRALSFARGEQVELPGYDQDDYVKAANFDEISIDQLLNDYQTVRNTTISLFETFSPEMLMRSGIANNCTFTVRSLGFIIAGHELHHLNIIAEKYCS